MAMKSIFKKASLNNKIVLYLGSRDFFDDLSIIDPIDGVISVDKNYIKGRKVFIRIHCLFRYGREDMDDVLSGVSFKKDFHLQCEQIYPSNEKAPQKLTPLQVSYFSV